MKLIIYIPAFNEEESIQKVIANLPKKIEGIDSIHTLVIDDGSIDKTSAIAIASGAQVVKHYQNRGVGAAFHSALLFSLENDADILVSIDADGQFDPSEIPTLIQPIASGAADMVIGNRFSKGKPEFMPSVKYWGNKKVAQLIGNVCGTTFQDVSCGFRAYNREALLHLNLFGLFTYTHETIFSLVFQGLNVLEKPISIQYYPDRKSKVAQSILHYTFQTSKIIFRVVLDYQPIRFFGAIGSIFTLLGFGFEAYLMIHYLINGVFTPYKSYGFIGLGLIVFGFLVFIIALIADMLNRSRRNQDNILYQLRKIIYAKK